MKYKSYAVTAQRFDPIDSADDFPTPPWATRALIKYFVGKNSELSRMTCLEPACGAGHMAKVLNEYFQDVRCADAFSYGYGPVRDFLTYPYEANAVDWVITNPPFKLAEEFVLRSLTVARKGVAILARTVFLESIGRYQNIFYQYPPTIFAQFVERVPMIKGRLDKKATTATGYCWLIWEKDSISPPKLAWIPPCRRELELDRDYT